VAGTTDRHRGRLGWAIAVVVVILGFVNVIDLRVRHASLVIGPAGAVVLLAIAAGPD